METQILDLQRRCEHQSRKLEKLDTVVREQKETIDRLWMAVYSLHRKLDAQNGGASMASFGQEA